MSTQNIVVTNLKTLKALKNHTNGELAYVKETKEIYTWVEEKNEWIKVEAANGQGLELNLYDLNKSIISQLTPMTKEEIFSKEDMLNDYRYFSENTHYMLLCKDFNYYTIFSYSVMPSFETFGKAIITIISELGEIYSIEQLQDGAIEIWIKPVEEESPYAFYLFPYDAGVVYYG